MAKQVVTILTDDLDGGEADRSIEFGLDGVHYTIDLSDENIGRLRKILDPYLAVATRSGRTGAESRSVARRAAAPTRTSRQENQAIRSWAEQHGHELSERGRIPRAIAEAYRNRT